MSDLVVEILILFFEVLCSKIFCEIFGKVRNKGWINIVQLFVLEISVFIMARTFSNVMILKQIVVASIYAGVMLWHVKISIGKSFALGLLYQASKHRNNQQKIMLLFIFFEGYTIMVW